MGPSKKTKRKTFIEKYKPSTEKYRIKIIEYRNNTRLLLYARKLEIIHGLLAGERVG